MSSLNAITFFLVVLVSVIVQDGLAGFPPYGALRYGRRLNLNQAEPEPDDDFSSKFAKGPSIEPLSPEQFPTSGRRAQEDPTLPPDLLDVPLATSTSKPSSKRSGASSKLPEDGLPSDDPIEPEDMDMPNIHKGLSDVPRDPILLGKLRSAHRGILNYNRAGYYGKRRSLSSGFRRTDSDSYDW